MSTSRLLGCALVLLCSVSTAAWAQDNNPPSAIAGPDQLVTAGAFVTLDGSTSFDVDGDPITLLWQQVLGDPVTLSNTSFSCIGDGTTGCSPGLPMPTFTAPATAQVLQFKLTVTDVFGAFTSDSVNVSVSAVPEPAAVWFFGTGLLALLGAARLRKRSA